MAYMNQKVLDIIDAEGKEPFGIYYPTGTPFGVGLGFIPPRFLRNV